MFPLALLWRLYDCTFRKPHSDLKLERNGIEALSSILIATNEFTCIRSGRPYLPRSEFRVSVLSDVIRPPDPCLVLVTATCGHHRDLAWFKRSRMSHNMNLPYVGNLLNTRSPPLILAKDVLTDSSDANSVSFSVSLNIGERANLLRVPKIFARFVDVATSRAHSTPFNKRLLAISAANYPTLSVS